MKTTLNLHIVALLFVLPLISACESPSPEPVEPRPAAQVLDSTSHDFVWDFDTVGCQLSTINGIGAVSTTDIWVTGKFFEKDSTGKTDPIPRGNVAHWNGNEWTYHGFNSSGLQSWYLMDDAFARSADNIWVCGGSPFRWDGVRWKTYRYDGFYFGSGIRAIWSTMDQQHVCAVGYKRSCVLYSAADDEFHWVDIPRDQHCYSVIGKEDGTMFVGAGNPDNGEGHVYRISPEGELSTYFRCPDGIVMNVWLVNDSLFVSSDKAILSLHDPSKDHLWEVLTTRKNIVKVVAEAPNNIVATTEGDYFLHFNGSTWKEIPVAYPKSVSCYDVSVVGRDVYLVGHTPEQYCVIMHARRL